MRWEDERYVRLYSRDTVDWLALSWEARALLCLLLRKVDRAGLAEIGRHGPRGLALLVGMPPDVVERVLPELLDDGCVELRGTTVVVRNFIAAQEASASDAQRKRDQRERDLAKALAKEQSVTPGHAESQPVTGCHEPSQPVTPSLAVPSVPSVPNERRATRVKNMGPTRVNEPAAEREEWTFQEWQQWAQYTRQEAGFLPEDPVPIYEGESWWLKAMEWTGGEVQPVCDGFIAYGADEYWLGQKPALPLKGFLSQWARYMPRLEKHEKRAHG